MLVLAGCVGFLAVAGCEQADDLSPKFIPNKVYAYKIEYSEELPMDTTSQEVQVVLGELFGTPDNPKLPKSISDSEEFKAVLDLEKLKTACGLNSGLSSGESLYAKNCINCHGWEGSGRGPGSAGVDPYPRDFRAGVFKYKSTTRLSKPLKSDLVRTVRYGLAGSGMGAYDKLTESEIESLVEYVVYLSIRGEVERKLLDYAISEFDLDPAEDGKIDHWVVVENTDASATAGAVNSSAKIDPEKQEVIDEVIGEVVTAWLEGEESLVEIEKPTEFPVLDKTPDAWEKVTADPGLLASVTKGKELFLGATAACSSCHGPGGLGDGQLGNYDDWTKEWTVLLEIDPKDRDALIPFMLRGALPPKNIKPRNLRELAFRGGRTPEDIYRRVRHGIAGAPMSAIAPVATAEEAGLTEKDLWHLVNYVLSMPVEPKPWPVAPVVTGQPEAEGENKTESSGTSETAALGELRAPSSAG
jgi:mono/diheme cytochrome c family protein